MKKKFGDRYDAKRVILPSLMQMCIDLKPKRANSDVYINMKLDLTALSDFISEEKKQGKNITFYHAFCYAIGRVIYNRSKLNRFVANRHMYEHNDVSISYIAKTSFNDKSEELMLVYTFSPEDTVETIGEKIREQVDRMRSNMETKAGANSAVDVLAKLPNIIRVPIMGIFKFADNKGILPQSLTKDNLYYSSVIVSNLGSIHCGAIYHNLTNFGTCSHLASFGEIKNEKVMDKDGNDCIRKMCEFGINLDERVADGYYFAKSAKMIEYILLNPEMLNEPVNTPIEMPEIR